MTTESETTGASPDGTACGQCSQAKTGACPGADNARNAEQEAVRQRLESVRHKVVVLSGKGGVGKSTVAVNLAVALSRAGQRVGLLDADIHGPSIPTMLNIKDAGIEQRGNGLVPWTAPNLKAVSIGFFLQHPDDALIWRGPMKMGVLRQFLADVDWGELDWLIIDSPPGTGDEPLSICQLIEDLDGAVVVTTPQQVAAADVRKSINFCRKLKLPVLGLIENMSVFVCPSCGEVTEIFGSGAAESMARDFDVPVLARIPMDPALRLACDEGKPFIADHPDSPTAIAFGEAVAVLSDLDAEDTTRAPDGQDGSEGSDGDTSRFAVPIVEGHLALHFGHCAAFALIDATADGTIKCRSDETAPDHQPGLLPKWLAERNVNTVIAGGMGQRAQQLFAEQGIKVVVGAAAETPEALVQAYAAGSLKTGDNVCDH